MQEEDLLTHRYNVFSQNGEDGIIKYIFEKIGSGSSICCEFGAWDGIHLSNCRDLILQGWTAVLIEGDKNRYHRLTRTYADTPSVKPVHRFVDTAQNRLDEILREVNIVSLDLLSVDIDGLDYQIFESLDIRPRVICIEVGGGHDPRSLAFVPISIAKNNVGQPLTLFEQLAKKKGYSLVCYTGNAFFVLEELCQQYCLPSLSSETAYANYLMHLTTAEKEWLYLANLGIVPPFHRFQNLCLDGPALGIGPVRSAVLQTTARTKQFFLKRARSAREMRT